MTNNKHLFHVLVGKCISSLETDLFMNFIPIFKTELFVFLYWLARIFSYILGTGPLTDIWVVYYLPSMSRYFFDTCFDIKTLKFWWGPVYSLLVSYPIYHCEIQCHENFHYVFFYGSFPSPGDLPDPGIEPGSPELQADSLLTELWRKPYNFRMYVYIFDPICVSFYIWSKVRIHHYFFQPLVEQIFSSLHYLA